MTRRRGTTRPVLALALLALALAGCQSGSSPSDPSNNPIARLVYTALGASDAVGIGAFPVSDGYVFLLGDQMRTIRPQTTVNNLGINGAEIDEFLADMLESAVASNPEVITIWTGSNDVIGGRTVAEFARDLDILLGELRARTSATIFIGDLVDLTQAPLFILFPDDDVTRARVDAYNVQITRLAAEHGAVLVRLSQEVVIDAALFSIDGFHPSNEGHRRICEAFFAQIRDRI